MSSNHEEVLDVVDLSDQVIGTASKIDVYKKGLSNRIVHIFLINSSTKKIFIQKRGDDVRYLPGYYCTSAGGHVGSGEDYQQAAERELVEEIGIKEPITLVDKFIYQCPETNPATPRFISLYICNSEDGVVFNDGEVKDGSYLSIFEIDEIINKGEKIHPQLPPCVEALKQYLVLQ